MNFIDLPSLIQQNRNIFLVMGLFIVGTIVFNIIRAGKMKTSNRDFIAAHADAAKIFLGMKVLLTSEIVSVHSVDGAGPEFFVERGKSGFYAIPGTRTVEMSFTYSRPGILHKNVTKTLGPVKKELIVEGGKSYVLGFDRDNEAFTFDEITPA